jgi:hypothetical protein
MIVLGVVAVVGLVTAIRLPREQAPGASTERDVDRAQYAAG